MAISGPVRAEVIFHIYPVIRGIIKGKLCYIDGTIPDTSVGVVLHEPGRVKIV